jgi:hypothetical protein
MLDGGAVDQTGTGTGTVVAAVAIDDAAVECVDVTRANQRKAGASLHAMLHWIVKL